MEQTEEVEEEEEEHQQQLQQQSNELEHELRRIHEHEGDDEGEAFSSVYQTEYVDDEMIVMQVEDGGIAEEIVTDDGVGGCHIVEITTKMKRTSPIKKTITLEPNNPASITKISKTKSETNKEKDEIVSYQRFGRHDSNILANPLFKCHLCGFSCSYKETLLQHFTERHPN